MLHTQNARPSQEHPTLCLLLQPQAVSDLRVNPLAKRKYRGQSIPARASDRRLFAANAPVYIDLIVRGIGHALEIGSIW
jgi:hypothetical protein